MGGYFNERGKMEYIAPSGNTYELADMTMRLMTFQESVDNAANMRDRFVAMMKFLVEALGKEAVENELGSACADTVNLPQMASMYHRVDKAYWGEMNQERIDDAMAYIDKLKDAANVAAAFNSKPNNRQFKRVK